MTSATYVYQDIPCELDLIDLLDDLCIEPETEEAETLAGLVSQARALARPKVLFRECFIQNRQRDSLTIDGIPFQSKVLSAVLESAERVFPFVATCGRELDRIEVDPGDFLTKYWLETIKDRALSCSRRFLQVTIAELFGLSKASELSPGSGDASVWPLEQQGLLFRLLGDVSGLIGVELTESCLMIPTKTVSGIRFPTEVELTSCQLCRRADCPSRRAPFDRRLWESLH